MFNVTKLDVNYLWPKTHRLKNIGGKILEQSDTKSELIFEYYSIPDYPNFKLILSVFQTYLHN